MLRILITKIKGVLEFFQGSALRIKVVAELSFTTVS